MSVAARHLLGLYIHIDFHNHPRRQVLFLNPLKGRETVAQIEDLLQIM